MRMTHKLACMFAMLLVVFICALPCMAKAQTYTDQCQDPTAGGSPTGFAYANPVDAGVTARMVANKQSQLQNQQAARALFAPVDRKIQMCFDQVQAIFQAIGFHGSPLALLTTAAMMIILNLVQQVCSAVLTDLNQIKTFVLSQVNRLCLPLPNFGLGLGGLNLKPVTCNGISLLQPGTSPNGKDPINFDIRSLFPKASPSSPSNTTTYP
jgi:hypothetical protein